MTIKLIYGNCLKKMRLIKNKSIDMILTDLPYGKTKHKWDKIIPFKPLWKQYERIIKYNGAIVLTATQPFTAKLIMSNIKMFKHCWVWDKHIPRGVFLARYKPMQKHEDIIIFGKKRIKYYPIMIKRKRPASGKYYSTSINLDGKRRTYTHKYPNSIIANCWEANEGKLHPSQKPVSLMEYLIKTYTLEGDSVLDSCMGSCSTGVACINLNRNFIGVEKDKEIFKIAQKRIKKAKTNLNKIKEKKNYIQQILS